MRCVLALCCFALIALNSVVGLKPANLMSGFSPSTGAASKPPIKIAITGAAGQIGYNLLFRIANGDMLGKDQPVILSLIELNDKRVQDNLRGIIMELNDCAYPLLVDVVQNSDPLIGFKNADIAILVGARPRGPGMERKDLLECNAQIFAIQGKALNEVASNNCKVLVVGNPANTNAYICMSCCPRLPKKNFSALLRLDHNRSIHQLAKKLNLLSTASVKNVVVWGNHANTMYADYRFSMFTDSSNNDVSVKDNINDETWNRNTFIPTVSTRGSAIIEARGMSSCASAANAIVDHIHDWVLGTPAGKWTTMGVPSDGSYDIPKDVVFGFPVTCSGDGEYQIVQGLDLYNDEFAKQKIAATLGELMEEKSAVENTIQKLKNLTISMITLVITCPVCHEILILVFVLAKVLASSTVIFLTPLPLWYLYGYST